MAAVSTRARCAVWCARRVIHRSTLPQPRSGWDRLVRPVTRGYTPAGRLGPRALVAQGIEHRFPNPYVFYRLQATDLRFFILRARFPGDVGPRLGPLLETCRAMIHIKSAIIYNCW